jgi:hypothetical protein
MTVTYQPLTDEGITQILMYTSADHSLLSRWRAAAGDPEKLAALRDEVVERFSLQNHPLAPGC